MCLTVKDPAAGCAQCAPGFKLATKPLKGRRAALGASSFTVPYCVGSLLKSTVENEVVNAVGKLQPTVNKVENAKETALKNVAASANSTVRAAQNAKETALKNVAASADSTARTAQDARETALSSI